MQEEIYKSMYYKLTDEDREMITKYFNDSNLKELIGFCDALAIVSSAFIWRNAEELLKLIGEDAFYRDCANCGRQFDCEPRFALDDCGNRYKKWILMSDAQKKRLEILQKRVIREYGVDEK